MLPNAHNLNYQTSAELKVCKPTIIGTWMQYSLLGLCVLISALQAHATENLRAKPNLYAEKYVGQNDRNLKSLKSSPDTILELGKNQMADTTRMLENGFDMMGTSEFVSARIPAELAKAYGEEIKADSVLVYDTPTSITSNMVSLDGTKEGEKMIEEANDENAMNEKRVHYASYWAKLPMPLFGVHVIKLVKAAVNPNEERLALPGLKIIAVIKESPAAKANIERGDTLLKMGDVDLEKSDDLFAAVKRYAGQSVEVLLQHGDTEVKTTVALNTRQ